MDNFIELIIALFSGAVLCALLMIKAIPLLHKLKFGQVEREEGLDSHKVKTGTPTMGGIVFILTTVIIACAVNYKNITSPMLWLLIFALVGFGAIGFIDDALIVIKHNNDGLAAWQKYGLQSIVAIGFYLLAVYFVPNFDTSITIPVFHIQVELGWIYPVLVYFMFTATTNGVNLSDGLDGLATGLSMIAIAPFVIFAIMMKDFVTSTVAMAMIGSLLGFMIFNYYPAKIFMGDVGSLGLGGLLAALAILTNQELTLIIVGGVFVFETLSVIIQVISFKTRGKRVFKMAPIHHHFEMLGWSESQVVITFWFFAFVCGMIGIIIGVI